MTYAGGMAKPTKRKGSRSRQSSANRPRPEQPAAGSAPDATRSGPAEPTAAEKTSAEKPSTRPSRPRPAPTKRTTPPATGRYTPPIPKAEKVSPIWVPILMFAFLGLGMLTIILNYVNVLPGSDPSNTYLMIGLGLITAGFITATKYH